MSFVIWQASIIVVAHPSSYFNNPFGPFNTNSVNTRSVYKKRLTLSQILNTVATWLFNKFILSVVISFPGGIRPILAD